MALTDILFSQGEEQDFIVEVPLGILHAPSDIVFIATFMGERPTGTLHAPLEMTGGSTSASDTLVNELTLSKGTAYYAF